MRVQQRGIPALTIPPFLHFGLRNIFLKTFLFLLVFAFLQSVLWHMCYELRKLKLDLANRLLLKQPVCKSHSVALLSDAP